MPPQIPDTINLLQCYIQCYFEVYHSVTVLKERLENYKYCRCVMFRGVRLDYYNMSFFWTCNFFFNVPFRPKQISLLPDQKKHLLQKECSKFGKDVVFRIRVGYFQASRLPLPASRSGTICKTAKLRIWRQRPAPPLASTLFHQFFLHIVDISLNL